MEKCEVLVKALFKNHIEDLGYLEEVAFKPLCQVLQAYEIDNFELLSFDYVYFENTNELFLPGNSYLGIFLNSGVLCFSSCGPQNKLEHLGEVLEVVKKLNGIEGVIITICENRNDTNEEKVISLMFFTERIEYEYCIIEKILKLSSYDKKSIQ